MHKRATKQETELRVAHAAELVAEGQAYSSITSLVAAKYGISRRRARQITSNAYLLLKDDIEEGDLNRPEMTAKLLNFYFFCLLKSTRAQLGFLSGCGIV